MQSGALRPRRQLTWLFDLDNTLHDASHAIFPAINANMNALIARVLDAERKPAHPEAVNAVRLAYWQRYGATLLGMMRHHAVRAEDFLRDAHRFDDLPQMIRAERGLGRLLRRLPGKKNPAYQCPGKLLACSAASFGLAPAFCPPHADRIHVCASPVAAQALPTIAA